MTVEAVTLLFALLALACQAGVLAVIGLAAGGRWERVRRWRATVIELVVPEATSLAALVAGVAMAGSLYLSEVAHFLPCRLCWAQRAFMYPLGPLLAAAVARRRPWGGLHRLGLALAVLGACVSTYHVLLERFPALEGGATCDPTNPCSLIWVERLGYLTIPTMALSGFLAVITLLLVARAGRPQPSAPGPGSPPRPEAVRA